MTIGTTAAGATRRRRDLGLAWGMATRLVGVVAAAVLLFFTAAHLRAVDGFVLDFKGDLYRAGVAILHGRNPYDPQYLSNLATMLRAGGSVSSAFALPVYPAPILVATAPFALIPAQAAGILFTGLMAAAMITGLRLLGVRDWRCIALALISWPSVFGLALGAVGPLLVLGIGVAWRWRQRLWPTALAVAGVLAAKLFPWTLPIWLLLTRRYRALALTAVLVALVMVVAWAVIGFAGLAAYPQMLSDLAYVERGAGVSLVSLLMAAGVAGGLAQALALAAAAAILALAYRRSQRPGGDEIALSLTLIAALAASPVVWPHYYVLLFVPIALASPRLSWLWFVPLLTTLAPAPQGVVALLGWMLVTALVTVGAARRLAVPTTSGASWRHESDLTAGPLTE